jgi:uncharacterized protein YqgQ
MSIKEVRRAYSCDMYNIEVEKAYDNLLIQIPAFLNSDKVLKLSQSQLRALHEECDEASLSSKDLNEALANAYSQLGDYERFQSISLSLRLMPVA